MNTLIVLSSHSTDSEWLSADDIGAVSVEDVGDPKLVDVVGNGGPVEDVVAAGVDSNGFSVEDM